MKQRTLFSILCFVLVRFGISLVSAQPAQKCMNRGTFTPKSTYESNLHRILSSLPSNVSSQDGFYYNGSIGQEPNRVYAVGMCIPGLTSEDCSECIRKASDGLIQKCTNQIEAFSWPGDPTLCHVRYSNTSFSGTVALDPGNWSWNTANFSSGITEFREAWERLISGMIAEASTAKNRYKAEVAALGKFQDMYALVQCTPDLSSPDCENCLKRSSDLFQSCCGQTQGGVLTRPSCYLRWQFYRFSKAAFDDITVAPPPPVSVPVPQPAGDKANTIENGKSFTLKTMSVRGNEI